MRKPESLQRLRQRLAGLGCPAARTDRLLREIATHLEDGVRDGCARGLSASEAERQAIANLGEPNALAVHFMGSVRQAHWCGRHRILAFAVLPTVAFFVWFLGWMGIIGLVDHYFHFTGLGVKGVQPDLSLVKLGVCSAFYSGVVVVPAFFCWLAWTRCCGWTAMLLVCGSSSLHGLVQKLSVAQDGVLLGYSIARPDWVHAAGPVLIGVMAWWIARHGLMRFPALFSQQVRLPFHGSD